MTIEEFAQLLAAHGPDIDHWPSAIQRAARRLRTQDADARVLWEAALRRWGPPAGDGLEDDAPGAARVQAGIDASLRRIRRQQVPAPSAPWLSWRPAGAVFATMAVAGWLAGTWLTPAPEATATASLATLFTLAGVGGDWLVQ
ncbi:hypothetical protein FBZ89_108166 [Nitrospirillum amazonense]|uniref:Uncharacterized protein n=1 Tax=Nitrospirillum amazonense TaxID=28077 RepID=A0A560FBY6_9PROT|nr:hypothetical protein [Nitrospirillum amazonense]TWB19109.1 hypothetical protein FBZ89_108166 [Nitrospirillum amazonense]